MVEGISVVTTTWNEKENILALIQRVRLTLKNFPHEIIVVDDSSTDGTFLIAKEAADLVLQKPREGQTKGLLYGMKFAKFQRIVTIDADLENPPELIPSLAEKIRTFDVVVASRTVLPRLSEKIASKTIGNLFRVSDFFSNFRGYTKEALTGAELLGGETFGGELLVIAKKRGFRIGEFRYEPPPRRRNPRIGGTIEANFRIIRSLLKCYLILYF